MALIVTPETIHTCTKPLEEICREGRMERATLGASYYQQFDADYALAVPAEGYGGWKRADVEIDLAHAAVVVMHAWETGTYEQYPGWYRAVEYIPRARVILRTVFPRLLPAVRASGVKTRGPWGNTGRRATPCAFAYRPRNLAQGLRLFTPGASAQARSIVAA